MHELHGLPRGRTRPLVELRRPARAVADRFRDGLLVDACGELVLLQSILKHSRCALPAPERRSSLAPSSKPHAPFTELSSLLALPLLPAQLRRCLLALLRRRVRAPVRRSGTSVGVRTTLNAIGHPRVPDLAFAVVFDRLGAWGARHRGATPRAADADAIATRMEVDAAEIEHSVAVRAHCSGWQPSAPSRATAGCATAGCAAATRAVARSATRCRAGDALTVAAVRGAHRDRAHVPTRAAIGDRSEDIGLTAVHRGAVAVRVASVARAVRAVRSAQARARARCPTGGTLAGSAAAPTSFECTGPSFHSITAATNAATRPRGSRARLRIHFTYDLNRGSARSSDKEPQPRGRDRKSSSLASHLHWGTPTPELPCSVKVSDGEGPSSNPDRFSASPTGAPPAAVSMPPPQPPPSTENPEAGSHFHPFTPPSCGNHPR
jgi:hypothetical protein